MRNSCSARRDKWGWLTLVVVVAALQVAVVVGGEEVRRLGEEHGERAVSGVLIVSLHVWRVRGQSRDRVLVDDLERLLELQPPEDRVFEHPRELVRELQVDLVRLPVSRCKFHLRLQDRLVLSHRPVRRLRPERHDRGLRELLPSGHERAWPEEHAQVVQSSLVRHVRELFASYHDPAVVSQQVVLHIVDLDPLHLVRVRVVHVTHSLRHLREPLVSEVNEVPVSLQLLSVFHPGVHVRSTLHHIVSRESILSLHHESRQLSVSKLRNILVLLRCSHSHQRVRIRLV